MGRDGKRYEQIPHTADLAARIFGATMPELFENAAYAMFSLMGDLNGLKAEMSGRIEAEAPDRETLLVSWLNELLYTAYSGQILFFEFNILELSNDRIVADVKGQGLKGNMQRLRSEIKAATYHDLEIKKSDSGYEVVVVFDV